MKTEDNKPQPDGGHSIEITKRGLLVDKKIMFCENCGEAYQTDKIHECITTATLCRDLILSLKIQDRPKRKKKDLIAEIEINKDRITNVSAQVKKMIDKLETLIENLRR